MRQARKCCCVAACSSVQYLPALLCRTFLLFLICLKLLCLAVLCTEKLRPLSWLYEHNSALSPAGGYFFLLLLFAKSVSNFVLTRKSLWLESTIKICILLLSLAASLPWCPLFSQFAMTAIFSPGSNSKRVFIYFLFPFIRRQGVLIH